METSIYNVDSLRNAFERLAQGNIFLIKKLTEAIKPKIFNSVAATSNSEIKRKHKKNANVDVLFIFDDL